MRALLGLLLILAAPCQASELDSCQVDTSAAGISIEPDRVERIEVSDYGMVSIECAAGLSYQVEVSGAEHGGVVQVIGTNPGNRLPVALADMASGSPLGALANGEALSRIGTGEAETLSIRASVATESMPPADEYSAEVLLSVIF